MTDMTNPRAILITGASSGIGKTCSLYFDSLGFTVFAGVRREQDAISLSKLASGDFRPIHIDVTSNAQIESAFEQVTEVLGLNGLTGLVNNAGIPLGGPLEFLSIEDFRNEIEVNLVGAVSVTLVLPFVHVI